MIIIKNNNFTRTNTVNYLSNSYSKTGSHFKQTTIEAILLQCYRNLPKDGEKSKYGSLFVYDAKQLGIHLDDEKSTGIILIDLDNLDKETAKEIFKYFELLSDVFKSLLAIQYSASHYTNSNKSGIHIYVKSDKLNYDDYKYQSSICLALISQLIKIHLGIDLLEMETIDKKILDFHNTNLYQRFNLFYSEFKYNENAEEFNLNMISFEDLEKLIKKYNLKTQLDEKTNKTISPIVQNLVIGDKIEKIKIDRHFHIGDYSGNDIRYRISIIADKLFGENAKDFCDKYFYYENGKSIYTHYSSGNKINKFIYQWLVYRGYIIENKYSLINNWISEYSDEIVNEIQSNNQLEIIAPTGTGKTTYINEYLAHELNSVVIVPFNVTNKLYNNLFEINSLYIGEIPDKKPLVMIWDQAIKHWDKIKDRHLIIDECHTLFYDRNYRNSAIKLMNKIKEENNHVTFVTATPAGEKDLFNLKQMRFFKKRKPINITITACTNIDWAEYNYIKSCVDNNYYDRVVLLDDMNARKVYEKLVVDGYGNDISYIRSSTKDTQDFIDLREQELLTKRITICTCVAFNGLNFKNTGERILVIGSIYLGITTSGNIVQQIGRIRNSYVKGIFFYNPKQYFEYNIENNEIKAKEMNELCINGIPDTFLKYNRKFLNNDFVISLKEIESFTKQHSNIESINMELNEHGYFEGIIKENMSDNNYYRMSLALKRKASDELKKDILDGIFLNTEYDDEYKKKWSTEIVGIISNSNYSGITIETFIELINKSNKHKLIETTINNIKEIIRILQVDEIEYKNFINNVHILSSNITNRIDRIKFMNNAKRIKEIREKYIDKIKLNNQSICYSDIINDVIEMEYLNQLKEKDGGKVGGKIGGKIGGKVGKECEITDKMKQTSLKKYNLKIGQKFKSSDELAKYVNKSNTSISMWRKKGWIK